VTEIEPPPVSVRSRWRYALAPDRRGMCSECSGAARTPSDRRVGMSMWCVRHRARDTPGAPPTLDWGRECARLGTAVVGGLSTPRGWFRRADPASRTAHLRLPRHSSDGPPLKDQPQVIRLRRRPATYTILARLIRSRRGHLVGHESSHETRNHRVCNDDVGVRRFGAGVGYRPSRARLWPCAAVPLVPRGILAPGMGLQLRLEYLPR
jgi:hypothetical protein